MKHLLFTAIMLACQVCVAQQLPDYYVYLVKGNVSVVKPGAKPAIVKQNQYLYKNDMLTIAKNAEVTLVNRDGKMLVLNAPGSIKETDLAVKFNAPSLSVTKTYLHLAFHELVDPDYDYTSFKEKNVGGTKGGVSRGDECNNLIFPVKDLKASQDTICFKWHQSGSAKEYSFIIYDTSAKEIVNMPVKDTQLTVGINEVLKSGAGRYWWIIKSKDGSCEDDASGFEMVNTADEQKLVPALILQKGNKDLLSQLQIVDELEKDKWIYTAMNYYNTIVQQNAGNGPLLKSYILFLLKYGFDNEAQKAWKNAKAAM
jgi:hypothetical protein